MEHDKYVSFLQDGWYWLWCLRHGYDKYFECWKGLNKPTHFFFQTRVNQWIWARFCLSTKRFIYFGRINATPKKRSFWLNSYWELYFAVSLTAVFFSLKLGLCLSKKKLHPATLATFIGHIKMKKGSFSVCVTDTCLHRQIRFPHFHPIVLFRLEPWISHRRCIYYRKRSSDF